MCGICLILGTSEERVASKERELHSLLISRGPDLIYSKTFNLCNQRTALLKGCVLWLQGDSPQKQPISDDEGNILLWNGDNFKFQRDLQVSDSSSIFRDIRNKSEEEIIAYIASIEGPWSFIYYVTEKQKIYFGRDIYGRHSLLWTAPQKFQDYFMLCSVGKREDNFQEVPALGVYVCNVNSLLTNDKDISLYPFNHVTSEQLCVDELKAVKILNIQLCHAMTVPLCEDIPSIETIEELKSCSHSFEGEYLSVISNSLDDELSLFRDAFEKAILKRIKASPNKCKNCTTSNLACNHSKFAVLFSGGLDSAVIAAFLAMSLPPHEPIDLINVSFASRSLAQHKRESNGEGDTKGDRNFNSPDRESGLLCLKQLRTIHKSRTWNFVEVNITTEELQKERSDLISHLIAPHSTVLDDSIGCALYFGGRGSGLVEGKPYCSPARVLFSGLGADEQLAGYSRHRGIFNQTGWKGLVEEIRLEMSRIHQRNCGRDDRVLSHHGRVVRFPFLDEAVVGCLNSIPIWKKTNLYLPRGFGEKLLLRLIAVQLSLSSVAVLPKRAIQFGSRIAKLEKNKEKGMEKCLRLQHPTS